MNNRKNIKLALIALLCIFFIALCGRMDEDGVERDHFRGVENVF